MLGQVPIVPSRPWQVSKRCPGVWRKPEKAAALPATPRHPNHSLPLLPSGPGGVYELSSRGDRQGHHRDVHFCVSSRPSPGFTHWRRGRDSNPRYGDKPYTHFPGVLLQPLGHLSARKTLTATIHAGRDGSAPPGPHPSLTLGANLRLSKFVPDEFVEPLRYEDQPYTHFANLRLQPFGYLSAMVKPLAKDSRPGKEAKG
jgi:hypothetical protein